MSHHLPAPAMPALRVEQVSKSSAATHSHRGALDHLGRTFAEALPVAVLIGEWESGASYLIDRFLSGIENDVAVVRITNPCVDANAGTREFYRAMGFNQKDVGLADLEKKFTDFLANQKNNNRRTIICFEETQDGASWVLDRVRRLVEIETKDEFGLMVILSGPPSLNKLLTAAPFDTIRNHAGQRIALAPFTLAETRDYISREIKAAKITDISQVIEFDAITLIHILCAGAPDTVDILCSKCIELAREEDTAPVATDLVKYVDKLLRQESMTQHSDAEVGLTRAKGANKLTARLIARMNGVVVQQKSLNNGHVLIGRGKLCDILVTGTAASRHHALVVSSAIGVGLLDLGSTNGTFVDGRLVKQHALQNGNVITVGDCTIAYVTGDARKARIREPRPANDVEPHNADPTGPILD